MFECVCEFFGPVPTFVCVCLDEAMTVYVSLVSLLSESGIG